MDIKEKIELAPLSYMNIGGQGKYLIEIDHPAQIYDVCKISKKEKLPIIVLGEGSNTIFKDGLHKNIFLKLKNEDIIKIYEDENFVNIKVDAGVNWDKFVEWSVKNNYSGIEKLSGIPGSVGAAPIQNIGAYGSEVSETITTVEIFSIAEEKIYEISNSNCAFSYRDSVFKKNLGEFVILNVSFRLSKKNPEMPEYKDLALYFLAKQTKTPSLKQIRNAVLEIRSKKLPDWKKTPNTGSFFKNPVVSNKVAFELEKTYPDLPKFKITNKTVKIPAGWLIEKSGFKGKQIGNVGVYKENALVLYANNGATYDELKKLVLKIIGKVQDDFNINLEIEPNIF
jgi:UDP-N-acetylmuramate dehydrogenase